MLDPDGVRHPLAKFAHVINVYLNSAFAVTSQAAEEMAKNEPLALNQRGVIINTASIAGFEGQPGQAAYSAAKGGVIGMTLDHRAGPRRARHPCDGDRAGAVFTSPSPRT